MKTDSIGIYVHVPFCLRKCNYCDFCSYPNVNAELRAKYISNLIDEIRSYSNRSISVDTIFFGGGTPTLLSENEFENITNEIYKTFRVDGAVEFSVEANPKTVDQNRLSFMKSLGVNRLSIGMQSIHANELKKLGRIHTHKDFLVAFSNARETGFNNINVDIMYGIPDQTPASFEQTINAITSLAPEHISMYSLILEENTPLFIDSEAYKFPSEDDEIEMYRLAQGVLSSFGYEHYEISNYALSGCRCRHNMKYWQGKEYLGFGVAAHSFYNGVRFGNISDISGYCCDVENRTSKEDNEQSDRAFEYIMLHLRLSDGFSLSEFTKEFGFEPKFVYSEKFKRLVENKLIRFDGDKISLSDEGFYVSNSIISDFL